MPYPIHNATTILYCLFPLVARANYGEKQRKSGLPPSCPAEASTTACLWRKNTVQWSKDPAPDRGQSRAGAGRKEANMEEQSRRLFGTMPDGTQVEEITLRSGGLTAGILTYGGRYAPSRCPAGAERPWMWRWALTVWRTTGGRISIWGPWWAGWPTASAGPASLWAGGSTPWRPITERTTSTAAWWALTGRCGGWRRRRRTGWSSPCSARTARRAIPATS